MTDTTFYSVGQAFQMTAHGLRPNTIHSFIFNGSDQSNSCAPQGLGIGSPLTTDYSGSISFTYYYNPGVDSASTVSAAQSLQNSVASTKVAILRSADGLSQAEVILTPRLVTTILPPANPPPAPPPPPPAAAPPAPSSSGGGGCCVIATSMTQSGGMDFSTYRSILKWSSSSLDHSFLGDRLHRGYHIIAPRFLVKYAGKNGYVPWAFKNTLAWLMGKEYDKRVLPHAILWCALMAVTGMFVSKDRAEESWKSLYKGSSRRSR